MLPFFFAILATQLSLFEPSASAQGSSSSSSSSSKSWPNGPFTTSGSWILDASNNNVTYVGVNWPGAAETMLPEGLQYQSIQTIVSRVKSLGMNSIRLTYATELVDQIYDNNMKDVPIRTAFTTALGEANGTRVFESVIANNPSFGNSTTRLQVFDAVAAECAKQEIYVHLDNHISKASWCCNPFDGNTWWNDTFFSPTNWTRGLSYMADHGKSWPNLMSMALYNELRPPLSVSGLLDNYTWAVWYDQVKRGSSAINSANPNVLIFLSGLDGDTDLQPVVEGTALTPSNTTFNKQDFAGYQDKLVLELHSYDIVFRVDTCPLYNANLIQKGYSAVKGNATNRFPVVMTEWGFAQDDTWRNSTYATCVLNFLKNEVPGAGWMVWALGGSYYIRQGVQDYDEVWGLLNHNWSDWRSPDYINGGLKPLITSSLSALKQPNSNSTVPTPSRSDRLQSPISWLECMMVVGLWTLFVW